MRYLVRKFTSIQTADGSQIEAFLNEQYELGYELHTMEYATESGKSGGTSHAVYVVMRKERP